jgi:ABC-type transport system involved in multi-copper enzyme maturation permease subunit
MLEMISAEWFKAFRKKRFWVLLVLFGVIAPLIQLVTAGFLSSRVSGTVAEAVGNDAVAKAISEIASPYSLVRNAVGGVLPLLLLPLAAIVGIFLVGEERTFKMWKTILVANPDRMRVLASKFITGMLILGAVILSGIAGGLVFGTIAIPFGLASSFAGNWGEFFAIALLQWVVLAAPLALGFLISWLFASPAIAVIGVVVLPALIEGIATASIVFQLNRVSALNAAFQAERLRETLEQWQRFFFTPNLNLGQRLIGQSLQNAGLGDFVDTGAIIPTIEWDKIWWSVGAASVYALVFAAIMIWSFKTRDIHE